MDLKEELRLHEEEELHLATDIDQGLVAVTDRRIIVTHAVRRVVHGQQAIAG